MHRRRRPRHRLMCRCRRRARDASLLLISCTDSTVTLTLTQGKAIYLLRRTEQQLPKSGWRRFAQTCPILSKFACNHTSTSL